MYESEDQQNETPSGGSEVDHGRRELLVKAGKHSALAAPAMVALLTASKAEAWNGSGMKPKKRRKPKGPKRPRRGKRGGYKGRGRRV